MKNMRIGQSLGVFSTGMLRNLLGYGAFRYDRMLRGGDLAKRVSTSASHLKFFFCLSSPLADLWPANTRFATGNDKKTCEAEVDGRPKDQPQGSLSGQQVRGGSYALMIVLLSQLVIIKSMRVLRLWLAMAMMPPYRSSRRELVALGGDALLIVAQ